MKFLAGKKGFTLLEVMVASVIVSPGATFVKSPSSSVAARSTWVRWWMACPMRVSPSSGVKPAIVTYFLPGMGFSLPVSRMASTSSARSSLELP